MQQIKTKYVDIPELSETFADSIGRFSMDGQTLRIEFCVTRIDDPKPQGKPGKPAQQAPTGQKLPACRLVMPANGLIELANKINQLVSILEQKGIIKKAVGPDSHTLQ